MSEAFNPDAFLAETPAPTPPGEGAAPMSGNAMVQNSLAAPHDIPVDNTQVNQFDPDRFISDSQNAQDEQLQSQHGGTGDVFKAFGEGAAQGVAGPLAGMAERAAGAKPEDVLGREEANPIAHGLGEVTGLVGSMLTGVGEAALAEKAAAKLVGNVALKGGAVAKIGSAAAKGAIENMIITSGDETNHMILNDPNATVQNAALNVGLSGLLGGGISGSLASISPLWHATIGNKVGGVLQAVQDHMGGIEGTIPDSVTDTLSTHFPNLPPEVKAALSSDPKIKNWVDTLNQSDTSSSGREYQQSLKTFRSDIEGHMVEALGHTPESIGALPEVNNYERGKALGDTLSKEFSSQVDPIAEKFNKLKEQAKSVPLQKDVSDYTSNSGYLGKKTIPGTGSQIADKIGQKVADEAWAGSPDIMKEVTRVMKALPEAETLQDLTRLQTEIGNNTASKLGFVATPESRAGMILKGIIRDAEDAVTDAHFGEKGAEVQQAYRDARSAYARQSQLKEALGDRLGLKGSTSSYAKGLKEMANTDGESMIRKLSGKNDADLLGVLSKNFPKTAESLKQYHIDSILQKAMNKTKEGQVINSTELNKQINSMDPNLRDFIFSGANDPRPKVNAMSQLLDRMNSPNHNFSNTARTMDKLLTGLPGSAVGAAALLTGHGAIGGALLGGVGKILTKDAPDAIKLSMLKYLGSGKEINSGAFKTMVDYIQAARKGAQTLDRGASAVFKAGREVISPNMRPTEKDRKALDKSIKDYRDMPDRQLDNGTAVAHYLPDHGTAMAQTGMQAANYLNNLRPDTQRMSPLDTKPIVNSEKIAAYNNALNIAEQPMIVLDKIKSGSITPQDITHLRAMYPSLYNQMVSKVSNEMTEHMNKGEAVPYRTRQGLSLFMGQPLDSTMTPQAIMAAQPVTAAQPDQGGQAQKKPSEASMTGMQKLGQTYQTPAQYRESARAKGKH